MIKRIVRHAALGLLVPVSLTAQSVTGDWQGTRLAGPRPLRTVVRVGAASGGRLTGLLLRIDEGEQFERTFPADTVRRAGRQFTATWTSDQIRFVGTVSASGDTIRGTWTEGQAAQPLTLVRATRRTVWRDSTRHARRLVGVDEGVALEVLDWGGSGPPVVLLAGNGNTAHVFDEFAPKLAPDYHVYGITRRGFGRSSAPETGYLADSLADDVLAVLDTLGLRRPVLVGHSLAGEELSSIGSRRPGRVAGLVYLDAISPFAYYDPVQVNWALTTKDAHRKLLQLVDPAVAMSVAERRAAITELVETSLPRLERDLREWERALAARPNQASRPAAQSNRVQRALTLGHQPYTTIRAPALALVAFPMHAPPELASNPAAAARAESLYVDAVAPQVAAFERGVPGARVVRLPRADHYVFRSNEVEVLRELRSFIDALAPPR